MDDRILSAEGSFLGVPERPSRLILTWLQMVPSVPTQSHRTVTRSASARLRTQPSGHCSSPGSDLVPAASAAGHPGATAELASLALTVGRPDVAEHLFKRSIE